MLSSAHPSCWDEKPKDCTCLGNPVALNGGMSLLISTLDKTPERWCLCLLTDGLFIWHLAGGRYASISQSIVHLIQCSVALVKIQGNTLLGFLFCLRVCGFSCCWDHSEFRVRGAVKSCSYLTMSLGYCSWAKQLLGLKHNLSWKYWEKENPSLRMLFLFVSPCSDLSLVSNRSLLCFWLASVGPF